MGHFKRGRKWQNPVPFRLGPKVASNNALVSRINKAIAEYENQTKVRFVTRTYENEFIIFVAKPKGTSSQAQVG